MVHNTTGGNQSRYVDGGDTTCEMAPDPGLGSGEGRRDVFVYDTRHQMPLFVQPVPQTDKCVSCMEFFRPPVKQIVCGHRICGACVKNLLHQDVHHCPGDDDECRDVDLLAPESVLPDIAKQRELQKLQVFCFLCNEIVMFGEFMLHLKICRPMVLMTPPPADVFTYDLPLQMPRFLKLMSKLPKCVFCKLVLRPPVKQIVTCGHQICGFCEKKMRVLGISSCPGEEELCHLVDIQAQRSILPDISTQREFEKLDVLCFLCNGQVKFGELLVHLRLCKPEVLMIPPPDNVFVYDTELPMPQFVKPLSKLLKCVYCLQVLRPPIKQIIRCGHQICGVCESTMRASGATMCPGNDEECPSVNIWVHRSVLPDNATQREFQHLDVHCYKCMEVMKFEDLEGHVRQCEN